MAIKFTERAAKELKAFLDKEVENKTLTPDAVLRLGVVGGGCSGFMYRMHFDLNVGADDRVEELNGIRVVVDPKSYLYLKGTEVDFHDGLMGKGFVFSNPNAVHTCGCNQSFSA